MMFVWREAFAGLRRNLTMSIAMVITTAISLGLLGAGLLAVRTIDRTEDLYYSLIAVQVALDEPTSADDRDCSSPVCTGLRGELEASPLVASVEYESRDDAFARFQRIYAGQSILQLVRPQSLPATLRVTMADPLRGEEIVTQYTGRPGVRNVVDQRSTVADLFSFLGSVRNATFGLAVVQALAALLLISNTIQLSAFTRRTEVGIMRLVGATRWYTQVPFLIEAVVTGVVGAVLATGGLVLGKVFFLDGLMSGRLLANTIPPIGMSDVLGYVGPVLVVVGAVIATATGYVTLRLYVRT
ncbi:permease-like cell division protein FtsX [Actinomycetospora callitridis]|uniref:permease-like cell division protein FtsX n=1 Tax=Actinomycetospora callitridis TaxID=913944 RepID=UPI002365106F|nr:permease-like cell division protein FtsX [Actinomycetospora callitridis]MDD7917308.1 permease-like cell division protein FtsX [Actinomycetospora callitridis]